MGHEWISFQKRFSLSEKIVDLGGRCAARLEELTSHPVKPNVAAEIETVFLSKGVQGTTAIEGNTLTIEQIKEIVQKKAKEYPPSKKYLQLEIVNVLQAYEYISDLSKDDEFLLLKRETIAHVHRIIAHDLEHIEAVPGMFRTGKVIVGSVYIPPEAADVNDMLEKLNKWLISEEFSSSKFLNGVIKAIIAHVYLAWIHPFDDGNGRTARTIEYGLLQCAGVPNVGAVLLANHYNLTREQYMRHLRRASTECKGDLTDFVLYALQGLYDSLGEALEIIRSHVFLTSWENYVYETFRKKFGSGLSEARGRARTLILWLSEKSDPMTRSDILGSVEIVPLYSSKTPKTLTRDIGLLRKIGLIREIEKGRYSAKTDIMNTFKISNEKYREIIEGDNGQLELFPGAG